MKPFIITTILLVCFSGVAGTVYALSRHYRWNPEIVICAGMYLLFIPLGVIIGGAAAGDKARQEMQSKQPPSPQPE